MNDIMYLAWAFGFVYFTFSGIHEIWRGVDRNLIATTTIGRIGSTVTSTLGAAVWPLCLILGLLMSLCYLGISTKR